MRVTERSDGQLKGKPVTSGRMKMSKWVDKLMYLRKGIRCQLNRWKVTGRGLSLTSTKDSKLQWKRLTAHGNLMEILTNKVKQRVEMIR